MKRTRFGAAVAALVVLAAISSTVATGTFAGANGRIAFTMRTENGNFDIYTMLPDGTDVRQVTTDPARDFNPRWSPGGTRIAFSSNRDGGDPDIWSVNADGTGLVRVTGTSTDTVADVTPSWTADGKRIVFWRLPQEMWVANADGSGGESVLADGLLPGTSAQGKKIAYTDPVDTKLHLLNLADGSTSQVTTGPANQSDFEPSWSPRGNDLVFSRDTTGTQNDLYLVHTDGTGLVSLTDTPSVAASEGSPAWSPDGARIAFSVCDFTGGVQGNCAIATMSRDGTDVMPISIQGALFRVGGRVDWQPLPRS